MDRHATNLEQIRVGGDRNFGYLLADRDARQGVLIDPSYSPETLVERAKEQSLRVTHIINTHGHPDHINGNEKAAELTGAPIAGHPALPTPPDASWTRSRSSPSARCGSSSSARPGTRAITWSSTNRHMAVSRAA